MVTRLPAFLYIGSAKPGSTWLHGTTALPRGLPERGRTAASSAAITTAAWTGIAGRFRCGGWNRPERKIMAERPRAIAAGAAAARRIAVVGTGYVD
jgi:hypothetical protein